MKEIALTGGITAHRGYLITKALFAAKPVTRKIICVSHMSGLAGRIAYTSDPMRYAVWIHIRDDARHDMVNVSAG